MLKDDKNNNKKLIKCNKCDTVMERSLVSILNTPWHCDLCNNYGEGRIIYEKDEVQNKIDELFNNEYLLLEYNGVTKNAYLKHLPCNQNFNIRTLNDLFVGRNRGCPKCYRFKSIGENFIEKWLQENNISYIAQKTFHPKKGKTYRFDFYIPALAMAIEYQGEQHYRDNLFFKDSLEDVERRDLIKKEYCRKNHITLIEIKYTQLKNIKQILSSIFNDYSERK